ncbi:MAG: hypothetical protein A2015_15015 [Spirochaetes bacterium GWF1_31_7]|nr:MAG: hypothetical protein A2Y30_08750 [Spirochaetes bacterium GWE1_32_154]OHD47132.1 MAG: hypothetical protein A2Y29_06020 [Spirochaetes bacterium GWE2_31_10]OHD48473.1 MAG: hypothetical protein A2015_15015 [Spirochaetes bacterium GWF1_31_7]
MLKEREQWIDTAKGIGILLVVVGHVFIEGNMFSVRRWIYSFHMPLFFFISGYLYRISKNVDFKIYIKNKFSLLIYPYFIFGFLSYIIYLIGYIIIVKYKGITNIPNFQSGIIIPFVGLFFSKINNGYLNVNMPLWFLPCLFVVQSFFYILRKVIKSEYLLFFVILSLSVLSYYFFNEKIFLPWSIDTAMVALLFYYSGYLMFQYKKYIIDTKFSKFILIISLILSMIFSLLNITVIMGENIYGNFFIFLLSAISGIIFIILFSKLNKSKVMIEVGRNSLLILVTHGVFIYVLKALFIFFFNINLEFINSNFFIGIIILMITLILLYPTVKIINKYLFILINIKQK